MCIRDRWGSLWGYETCDGWGEMRGRGTACERSHWGVRWGSLWGNEACEGCARMGPEPHATWAF
eukprot:2845744-Pyramimonas_sp.AAC.1